MEAKQFHPDFEDKKPEAVEHYAETIADRFANLARIKGQHDSDPIMKRQLNIVMSALYWDCFDVGKEVQVLEAMEDYTPDWQPILPQPKPKNP